MSTDGQADSEQLSEEEKEHLKGFSEDARRGYLKEKARGTFNPLPKRDPDAWLDDDLEEDDPLYKGD